MIVLIDNYDSFTYNLYQYLGDLDIDTHVVRNDAMSVDELLALKPKGFLISPGPSDPDHAGVSMAVVGAADAHDIPLLGVCLGHLSIGQYYGGTIIRTVPMHGKVSEISHTGAGVFAGLVNPLPVARYHSLVVARESCPDVLEITAEYDGLIMGLQHKNKPIYGVQFHPESIATQSGHDILRNFIEVLS